MPYVTVEIANTIMELPLEKDGTLLLETLKGQCPNACGLRFLNNRINRAIKLSNGKLFAPDEGWGTRNYLVVEVRPTHRVIENPSRLFVGNLPWQFTDDALTELLVSFCALEYANVVLQPNGRPKGYGFVKFREYEAEEHVSARREQN